MAKKLSDDNPCKGCGARRSDRCICQASPKQVAAMARKRITSIVIDSTFDQRSSDYGKATFCKRNRECMLLNGHSRPECFTYADDAELARFRARMPNPPSPFRECGHKAYVVCRMTEGHDGPHQGNEILGGGAMGAEVIRRNRVN